MGFGPIACYLASVVIQMIGLRCRLFRTLDEALAFLASRASMLPDLALARFQVET